MNIFALGSHCILLLEGLFGQITQLLSRVCDRKWLSSTFLYADFSNRKVLLHWKNICIATIRKRKCIWDALTSMSRQLTSRAHFLISVSKIFLTEKNQNWSQNRQWQKFRWQGETEEGFFSYYEVIIPVLHWQNMEFWDYISSSFW